MHILKITQYPVIFFYTIQSDICMCIFKLGMDSTTYIHILIRNFAFLKGETEDKSFFPIAQITLFTLFDDITVCHNK